MEGIFEEAKKIEQEIIENRRYLHKNPEVGFNLSNTARFVKAKLEEMGIKAEPCENELSDEERKKFIFAGFPDMAKATGVVATIGHGEPCILLRADMDALPMTETADVPFASQNGFGHMCGHDTHTAMLLGAAKLLKQRENELKGTVKLMFQTGEECGCGSRFMVENGVLENPKVDAALAIHVMADQDFGTVQYSKGITSAAMDTFMLKIKGKGGHSSMPQTAIDPLMIANQVYTSLNLLTCREIDPRETVALTVGKCGGGTAANVIPDMADLVVGVRTFNREVRAHLIKRIPEMADHIIKAWRGEYDIKIFATPSTFTDAALCDELLPFIQEIVEPDKIKNVGPMAGSEDFGYVTEQVPGMFLCLGAGEEGAYPMHNPNMVIDERIFSTGAALLANCAAEWLNNNRG